MLKAAAPLRKDAVVVSYSMTSSIYRISGHMFGLTTCSGLPLCPNVKQVKKKMNLKPFLATELASRAGFPEM